MPDLVDRVKTALAGRYEITREIGRGGMATVYLAEDLRHGRQVAVKVLQPELSAAIGAERFLQEIRITAKLDHPHILTLIDSGEANGLLWYITPYVRGESLRQKQNREGQLPITEALSITDQVAGALDHAHRQGVIHRDLKPENVLLFEGEAILVDFGIALAVKEAGGERLTATGISPGTPQYMSPEQATGDRNVDARSDIYSLGALLYEMLAGEPPHTGTTVHAIIAKLLAEKPTSIRTIRDTVPEHVDAAVLKALAKLPVDRFATASELVAALRSGSASLFTGTRRSWAKPKLFAVTLTGGLALLLALLWQIRPAGGPAPLSVPRQITFSGNARLPSLSPDGEFLAYLAESKLFVMDLSNGDAALISHDSLRVERASWSPDGTQIRFVASPPGARELLTYTASRLGANMRRLPIRANAFFLEAAQRAVQAQAVGDEQDNRVKLALRSWPDGAPLDTLALPIGFGTIDVPALSPDGRWIAVAADKSDSMGILLLSLADKKTQVVVTSSVTLTDASWSADGDRLDYLAHGIGVMTVGIDRLSGHAIESPRLVLAEPQLASFAISADRSRIAYQRHQRRSHLWSIQLGSAAERRALNSVQITKGTASHSSPTVTPDGESVAFVREASGVRDLYTLPTSGGELKRITFLSDTQSLRGPEWSPDGRRLAFFLECRPATVDLLTGDVHTVGPTGLSSLDCYRDRVLWARDGTRLIHEGSRASLEARSLVSSHAGAKTVSAVLLTLGANLFTSPGRVILGTTSPNGAHAVFTWQSGDSYQMWLLTVADGSVRPLLPGVPALPILWSHDDIIYFRRLIQSGKPQEIWTVAPTKDKPALYTQLPVRCGRISMSRDGRVIVCDSDATEFDLWTIDNFVEARSSQR